MLPAAYTPQSRHLGPTAARAWVFGGMGSWNDIGFVDGAVQSEYRELSGLLCAATLRALLAIALMERCELAAGHCWLCIHPAISLSFLRGVEPPAK